MVLDVYLVQQIICDRGPLGIQAHKFPNGGCVNSKILYIFPIFSSHAVSIVINCLRLRRIVIYQSTSSVSLEPAEFP